MERLNQALALPGTTNRFPAPPALHIGVVRPPLQIEDNDNDQEALHLWSKLPDEIRRIYTYSRVLGRGSFGVVVLARSLTGDSTELFEGEKVMACGASL